MHQTGHYEAVRVTFDSDVVTYAQLLSRYWPLVDPTDAYGQFCDRGDGRSHCGRHNKNPSWFGRHHAAQPRAFGGC
mgnify:CR=1 FL=1